MMVIVRHILIILRFFTFMMMMMVMMIMILIHLRVNQLVQISGDIANKLGHRLQQVPHLKMMTNSHKLIKKLTPLKRSPSGSPCPPRPPRLR